MLELLKKNELELFKIKSYKKDKVLFMENEICKEVGFLLKGSLVIKAYTDSGKEIIYNKIESGGVFGNNLLFSGNKKYRGNVIAVCDTTIAYINKENLLIILRNNNAFLNAYLTKLANDSKELNSKVKLLSLDSAKDRLMYYLDINNNEIKFNTITSLARELNIQRETLSRLISKLVKDKVIIYKDNTIKRP